MDIQREIENAKADPERLERLYRDSQASGQEIEFRHALLALHAEAPDNLLYQAWFQRLKTDLDSPQAAKRTVNWFAAIPISIITGLFFWALSDFDRFMINDSLQTLVLWWSPIAAVGALIYLAFTSGKHALRAAILAASLLGITLYVMMFIMAFGETDQSLCYQVLATIHIPLLSWSAMGLFILGLKSDREERFAFLIKSVEVVITAGVYLIAGMVFGGITIGMFAALSIELPELYLRLIAVGGFGLLPVLALASVFDPTRAPAEQDFSQGLSRFIATMMRLLLPLTLAVLSIYLLVIPFNFLAPFQNRDVLIVYNLMLFGIMGLLLGATPFRKRDLSPGMQVWLRRGILAVAILAGLVSLYAMSAVVFRTVQGGITINRMMIIGWNSINIVILGALIINQLRRTGQDWTAAIQRVFSQATNAYLIWGLFLMLLIPILF